MFTACKYFSTPNISFLKQIKQISKTNSYCSGLKIRNKRLTLNPSKWTTGLNNWTERMLREITSPQFISLLHQVSGSQRLSQMETVTTSPELVKDDESLECLPLEGIIENTNPPKKKKFIFFFTHTTDQFLAHKTYGWHSSEFIQISEKQRLFKNNIL